MFFSSGSEVSLLGDLKKAKYTITPATIINKTTKIITATIMRVHFQEPGDDEEDGGEGAEGEEVSFVGMFTCAPVGGAVVILTLAGLVVNTNGVTGDVTLLTFVPEAVVTVVDGLVAGVVLARGSIVTVLVVTVLVAAGVLAMGASVVGAGVVGTGVVVGGGVGAGVCMHAIRVMKKN